ncbi:type IV pilin accessory protein [Acinetobacter haemolyticus]|nr:type IV pilin accessory protein [Acinetobacter haemolyticus]
MSKRLKFFLSHLSISFLIALLVIGLVFFIWYPSPLAKAVGVTHIFLMMLMIDVILGPLLGLLVYKEDKKTLKFDLSIIILIQLSALIYGMYSISAGRPVWLVFSVDRFELIKKNEVIDVNLGQAQKQFQHVSWKPQLVALQFAQDSQQRNQEMFTEVFSGVSLAQHPERYVELAKVKQQIKQRAQDLAILSQYNDKALVEKILAQYPQANTFVPLKANAVDMTVLIDTKGEVVKIVDLRPWR